jgi:sulfur carrier protein ThiS
MSDEQPDPGTAHPEPPAAHPEPPAAHPESATARERALRLAVDDIERHVAALGWDAPVFVFALVRTADAVAATPSLAQELPPEAVRAAQEDPEHLTSIEQDGLPEASTIEELLGQLGWPEEVDGAAIVVERMVVPPEAEQDMPDDPQAAVEYLMAHPERQDVRMAAGVLRTGESWCALRSRSHDFDDAVAGSPDAVPGLVEALRATFA